MSRGRCSSMCKCHCATKGSILECLCFSGVVFGYASLVFVLKEDGYFGHLCVSVPVTGDNLTAAGEQKERKKVQSVLSNKDIPE